MESIKVQEWWWGGEEEVRVRGGKTISEYYMTVSPLNCILERTRTVFIFIGLGIDSDPISVHHAVSICKRFMQFVHELCCQHIW